MKKKMQSILIIESEQALLSTLSEALEENGFAVDLATNGGEALRKVKNNPDLIVLDGLLTDIDGLALLAEIKSNQGNKHTPIIFLLEAGDEEKARKAAELGVTKSVIKTHYGLQGICDLIKKSVPEKTK